MAGKRKSNSNGPATELRGKLRELSTTITAPRVTKLRDARRTFERDYVLYVIAKLGDRGEAARALGIGLSTLKEKIRSSRR
jgi:DNA-binding NtrC family response regulator